VGNSPEFVMMGGDKMSDKNKVFEAPYSKFRFTTKGAILTSTITLAYIGT